MDPFHVPILHGTFSGTQFTEAMSRMPRVTWDYTERGVKSLQLRAVEGGKIMHRITEVVLPTLRVVANPFVGGFGRVESIGWTLPVDDTHYRIYTAGRVREKGVFLPRGAGAATHRKRWAEMTEDERRSAPGDWEAQVGQGPITFHSEEHLETSDKGVVMVRRLLQRQLETIAAGGDPINVSRDAERAAGGVRGGKLPARRLSAWTAGCAPTSCVVWASPCSCSSASRSSSSPSCGWRRAGRRPCSSAASSRRRPPPRSASVSASIARSRCSTRRGPAPRVRGDFGRSFKTGDPVAGLIADRLGPTLQLTGGALLVALCRSPCRSAWWRRCGAAPCGTRSARRCRCSACRSRASGWASC